MEGGSISLTPTAQSHRFLELRYPSHLSTKGEITSPRSVPLIIGIEAEGIEECFQAHARVGVVHRALIGGMVGQCAGRHSLLLPCCHLLCATKLQTYHWREPFTYTEGEPMSHGLRHPQLGSVEEGETSGELHKPWLLPREQQGVAKRSIVFALLSDEAGSRLW